MIDFIPDTPVLISRLVGNNPLILFSGAGSPGYFIFDPMKNSMHNLLQDVFAALFCMVHAVPSDLFLSDSSERVWDYLRRTIIRPLSTRIPSSPEGQMPISLESFSARSVSSGVGYVTSIP